MYIYPFNRREVSRGKVTVVCIEMETETNRIKSFGGSLPVENVQELASRTSKDIPSRYIRPEIEYDQVSVDDSLKIPVIDMSKLVGDQLDHLDELTKLHLACEDWGFFQLVNHGVQEVVINEMKNDMEKFFNLPLEEKLSCAQVPNSIEGYGQAFVQSEEQKLDWGDMLFILSQPVSNRNMRFWPTDPTSFRANLENYSLELQKIARCLLGLMGKNLGVDPEKFSSMFEDGTQGIRMNYYPPCLLANKVMGLTPHSDATGLTLLIQANDVQGLQIKKYGKWTPIKPIPGAFIINVGDIIEILSNGEYKSIEHRAIVNPERERLSIAAFHSPNITEWIGPLSELAKENKKYYKSLSHEEFIRLVVSSKLNSKSLLEQMKLG